MAKYGHYVDVVRIEKLSLRDRWQLWLIRHQIGNWSVAVANFNSRHGYKWTKRGWVGQVADAE